MFGVHGNPYSPQTRQGYLETAGFAMYNDVNDQMLADIAGLPDAGPIQQATIDQHSYVYRSAACNNPAGLGLYLVTEHVAAPARVLKSDPQFFYHRYGISKRDRQLAEKFDTHQMINHGFDALDFPWHIGAAVANACVDKFVDQGVMSPSDKDAMTLHDWAAIIGSGWFARLGRSLALGKNGAYRDFAMRPEHYQSGAFTDHLILHEVIGPDDDVFNYEQKLDPEEGLVHHTVRASSLVVAGLRKKMQDAGLGDTGGCPVARVAVRLPVAALKADPHVKNLLKSGGLAINSYSRDGKTVELVQDWPAIDKTFALFAWQLDQYEDRHGMPHVSPFGDGELTHQRQKPLDRLRWATPKAATGSPALLPA